MKKANCILHGWSTVHPEGVSCVTLKQVLQSLSLSYKKKARTDSENDPQLGQAFFWYDTSWQTKTKNRAVMSSLIVDLIPISSSLERHWLWFQFRIRNRNGPISAMEYSSPASTLPKEGMVRWSSNKVSFYLFIFIFFFFWYNNGKIVKRPVFRNIQIGLKLADGKIQKTTRCVNQPHVNLYSFITEWAEGEGVKLFSTSCWCQKRQQSQGPTTNFNTYMKGNFIIFWGPQNSAAMKTSETSSQEVPHPIPFSFLQMQILKLMTDP